MTDQPTSVSGLPDEQLHLLIVDDDSDVCEVLRGQFEDKYAVLSASNATQALKIMARQPVQVVISDQRMPPLTGVEFFTHISQRYPTTVRVLLTGYDDIETVIAAINEGKVFRYVKKPWTPAEIEKAVEDAFEHHRLTTENRDLLARLQTANEQLSRRVEERTAALHTALEESERHSRETQALLEAANAILDHGEFTHVVRAIFDSARQAIGAAGGCVALVSDGAGEDEMLFLDAGGIPCALDAPFTILTRELRARAEQTGQAAYENDCAASEPNARLPEGHIALESVLFAPMLVDGQTTGLLGLVNKPGGFTDEDARLASALADLAAVALRNSRDREMLEVNERRFRSVVQSASDAIILIDHEARIVFWNETAAQVFGHREADIIGQPIFDLIPIESPPDRTHVFEDLDSPFPIPWQDGTYETHGLHADGHLVPVEISISRWDIQDHVMFTAIVRDITARRGTEAAERTQRSLTEALYDTAMVLNTSLETNEVLRRILENVGRVVPHDAANIMLLDGDTLYVAGHRGYDAHDQAAWVGTQRWPITTFPLFVQMRETREPLVLPDVSQADDWTSASETSWIRSYVGMPIISKDQVIGIINLDSAQPGFFDDDHADRLKVFASQAAVAIHNAQLHDQLGRYADHLEERVDQRTAELRQTTERVEAVLRSTGDAIVITDVDGAIQQVNPAFKRLFGCDRLPPGSTFSDLVNPEQAQQVQHTLQEAIHTLTPQRLEISTHCDAGESSAEMVVAAITEPHGLVMGTVCTLHDVTARKQMETHLRQALEREVELSALKTRFISTVSHEFRTPLAVIQTSGATLSRYEDRLTPEQKRDKIDKIASGIQRIVALLDDVLTISAVDSQAGFKPETYDINSFCLGLVHEFQQTIQSSHPIVIETSRTCGDVVGDMTLVRHILTHLLANAAKFSAPGSPIALRVDCRDHQTILTVKDRGIGIPEADRENLFTAFSRASNVGTIPGTGLGLAIVKQSVVLHGGTITFESTENQGTTFTVTLPSAVDGNAGAS